ncbi:hypothetical protein GCM10022254_12140 [Actinomadura meridiana]|uniref:Uncharacterized protein n=1 Tax=Actinomadura meridiana TaxID=559626 RepID=A0ABP8BUL7_9ACTN
MTLVGAAVTPVRGQGWGDAIGAFESLTGRALPVRRCYDGAPPASVGGGQLRYDVGARKSVYSFKPTMRTPIATLEGLAADIVERGHDCDVIIFHEPVDDMSGQAFVRLYRRSAPPFRRAGVPVGVCFTNWSCNLPYSDPRSALRHYWPGEGLVDFVAIDEYPIGEITSNGDATPMDVRTRRVCQFADARGVPLGLAEYGVDVSWDVRKSERWLRSVTDWGRARAAHGKPLRWVCYFHSDVGGHYRLSHAEHLDAYRDTARALAVR